MSQSVYSELAAPRYYLLLGDRTIGPLPLNRAKARIADERETGSAKKILVCLEGTNAWIEPKEAFGENAPTEDGVLYYVRIKGDVFGPSVLRTARKLLAMAVTRNDPAVICPVGTTVWLDSANFLETHAAPVDARPPSQESEGEITSPPSHPSLMESPGARPQEPVATFPAPPAKPSTPTEEASGVAVFGGVVCALAVIGMVIFAFAYETGNGGVHNLSLAQNQTMGMMFSSTMALGGLLLSLFGGKR